MARPGRLNVMKYIWQEDPDLMEEKNTWKIGEKNCIYLKFSWKIPEKYEKKIVFILNFHEKYLKNMRKKLYLS